MSVSKHWLLGGWYSRGLIVHQQMWWRLFQKRVVCTKFDIYVFIDNFDTRLRMWWCYITRKHYNLISILPEWSTTYLSSTLLSENKTSICTIIYGRMVLPMYSSYLPRDESALWDNKVDDRYVVDHSGKIEIKL
jgi:hypothetical protein